MFCLMKNPPSHLKVSLPHKTVENSYISKLYTNLILSLIFPPKFGILLLPSRSKSSQSEKSIISCLGNEI